LSAALEERGAEAVGCDEDVRAPVMDFDSLYDAYFDFVWRSLRCLGVSPDSLDDGAQEVFLVVHRRLAEFEGRSSVKTWLFGIVVGVARNHRRRLRRKGGLEPVRDDLRQMGPGPEEALELHRALSHVERCLADLDDDKREVFVLAEIEGMTAPEIAEVVGAPVNTIYSRLRAARAQFDAAVTRLEASER
jgi:RNA polymerase sigma-70 factor (ECF subfamily)